MNYYLGLDISTSCTGWSQITLDDNQNVLEVKLGCINLSKTKDSFSKAQQVLFALNNIKREFTPTRIFIEENLQAFRPGASSAKTLVKLARFNGVVSYISQLQFDVAPEFVNVNHARKVLGIKIQREKICGVSTKQQVLNWVMERPDLNGFDWPTKKLKSGPRKGVVISDPICYDMADAYVIAMAGPNVIN
jgi:Holliday junction resolvasome RuvABC endonuclease subunit